MQPPKYNNQAMNEYHICGKKTTEPLKHKNEPLTNDRRASSA